MVSKLEKLLKRIQNNPQKVRFEELDKVLLGSGFKRRQPSGGSSHYIYVRGKQILSVPFKQPYIKAVYVEQAIKALKEAAQDEQGS